MIDFSRLLRKLISLIVAVVSFIPATIYSHVYAQFFTK